jgi:hypothetical protein
MKIVSEKSVAELAPVGRLGKKPGDFEGFSGGHVAAFSKGKINRETGPNGIQRSVRLFGQNNWTVVRAKNAIILIALEKTPEICNILQDDPSITLITLQR